VDPVAGGPTGGGTEDDGYDPGKMSGFSNAIEYLASLKGGKK